MLSWIILFSLLATVSAASLFVYIGWRVTPHKLALLALDRAPVALTAGALPFGLLVVGAVREIGLQGHLSLAAGCLALFLLLWSWMRLAWRGGTPDRVSAPSLLERPRKRFGLILALAGLAVLATLSTIFYGRMPFVGDCAVQLAHAWIYLQGRMNATPPPIQLRTFFQSVYMLSLDDVWRSQYFPGHIWSLAVAQFFGIAWLTNPLYGAGALWMLYSGARSLYGEKTGRLAALLLLSSPFFHILQSEMMGHGSALFFCVAAFRLLCCPYARRSRFAWESLGGFCLGMAVATRALSAAPAVAVILLAPPAVWSSDKRRGPRRWIAIALGMAPPLALSLVDNWAATGSPLITAYELANPAMCRLGFHDKFTPEVGFAQCMTNLGSWNDWLFGWPFTSYGAAVFLFASFRARRPDCLLLALTGLLSFVYFFYNYQDTWFGPRFLYEAEGWMALLSARGIAEAARGLERFLAGRPAARLVRLAGGLGLASLLIGGAWRTLELSRDYRPLLEVRRREFLEPLKPVIHDPNAIVFIGPFHQDFSMLWNIRFPQGPLFPLNLGEKNGRMLKAFPDRQFYVLENDVLTPLEAGNRDGVSTESLTRKILRKP